MTQPDVASPTSESQQAGKAALPTQVKIVLLVLVFSAMVMMLNETILSVALPAIMSDFQIAATTAQWLTTGFMLAMAIIIPTTGWLLQRFSTRAIFVAALIFFLAGTFVAALAPSFGVLLTGRILQAVGTSLIMPLLMTVSLTLVPAERRGSIMGLISIVMAVAPALGPTASGFILNALSWHWLFWVMIPLIAIALLVGLVFLRNVGETVRTPLDIPSVILAAIAFGGLIYALSSLSVILDGEDTQRWATLAVGVAGLVSLIIFAFRQNRLSRSGRALLDLAVFRIRNFSVSIAVLLVTFGALLGSVTVLPIYLQNSLGITALVTGLVLMPGGLVNGALSPFIGRIYDRVGPRPLLLPGAAILTATLFWMSTLNENSTQGQVIAMHVLFSVGLALMITPLMTTALGSLPRELYGHGSATVNTLQQLAGAAGTAILVVALTLGTENAAAAGSALDAATAEGTGSAFLLAGCIALVALIASPFVTRVAQDQHEEGQAGSRIEKA